mmetsp:Transcript_6725/g.9972  ORF Transcript_6725/g.9972 Transcript_6725/m.9972 type:complete len:403 (-) Transcript_6725:18-1226(-)
MLSGEDKRELEVAICGYLVSRGYTETAAAFNKEANLEINNGNDLLEQKWTTIMRLQRRVMELETKQEDPVISAYLEAPWCPRGPALAIMKGHRSPITCCVKTNDKTPILGTGSEDGIIKLWDIDRRTILTTLTNHVDIIHSLDISADSQLLLSASADRTAKIWALATDSSAKVERTLRGHEDAVLSACFLGPGLGRFCATACKDGIIRIFDLATKSNGIALQTISDAFQTSNSWPRALAATESFLAIVGNTNTCIVYSLLSGRRSIVDDQKPLCRLQAGPTANQLQCLAFCPNSLHLAIGGRDGQIYIWNISTKHFIITFDAHTQWVRALIWHPSGTRIVSCSDDRSIAVFDIEKRRLVHRIPAAHSNFVSALVFHPSSSILASAGADKTIRLWDSPTTTTT